jgi:hypothetical protein
MTERMTGKERRELMDAIEELLKGKHINDVLGVLGMPASSGILNSPEPAVALDWFIKTLDGAVESELREIERTASCHPLN